MVQKDQEQSSSGLAGKQAGRQAVYLLSQLLEVEDLGADRPTAKPNAACPVM